MSIIIKNSKIGVDITLPDNATYQQIKKALENAETFLVFGTFFPFVEIQEFKNLV